MPCKPKDAPFRTRGIRSCISSRFLSRAPSHQIARLPESIAAPTYRPDALPETEAASAHLLRLPAFPNADKNPVGSIYSCVSEGDGVAMEFGR